MNFNLLVCAINYEGLLDPRLLKEVGDLVISIGSKINLLTLCSLCLRGQKYYLPQHGGTEK